MFAFTLPFVAALTMQSAALCFGTDQLETAPCCTPVDLALPTFPNFSMPGQGICWNSCGVAAQTCIDVSVSSPVIGAQCGSFISPMKVVDCTGISLLEGDAALDYTRTWSEVDSTGIERQVWRFAMKVDLHTTAGTPPACPVPTCIPGYPDAFFYGYLDYSLDCATNTWEQALVLYHGCDDFIHMPLFSSKPGAFHPTETYAIVAPHTALNPFVPSPVPPLAGPLVGEGMRSTTSPIPGTCQAEEPMGGGALNYIASACLCPLSLNFNQQHVGPFSAQGVCGSSFTSLNLWPTLPWYDFVRTGIGRWSTAASYPGPESATVAEGFFLYNDACAPAGTVASSLDVFYGAITQGGFPVVPTPVQPTTQNFIDLASNYSNPYPGPVSFPLVGQVLGTDHLIYTNVP